MTIKIENTGALSTKRFYGIVAAESGIGKTWLARTFPAPEERVIIGNAESGLMSLNGTNIPVYSFDMTDTWKSMCEFHDFLEEDDGNTYDYVYIDSLTELAEKLLEELKRDPKLSDPKNSFLLWGKLKDMMKVFLRGMRDLKNCTVVYTCLVDKEKDGLSFVDTYKMPGSIKSEIKPFFDIVLHYKIFEDEDGSKIRKLITSSEESTLAKDRSGLLDKYEDADLSVIINKVTGRTK